MLRVGVKSISNKLRPPRKLTSFCLKTKLANLNQPRYFSASSSKSNDDSTAPSSSWTAPPSEPDTVSNFPETTFNIDGLENLDPTTIPIENLDAAIVASEPLGTNPIHLMMGFIDNIHTTAGIPYWEAIVIGTIALRIALIYPAIIALQNTNRMTLLRPKMAKLQEEMNTHPNAHEMPTKMEYQRKMTQLMVDNNVNPVRSLAMPLFQLPISISIFFALRDMGSFFPDFASGGAFWFTDLAAADPYYILPVVNGITMLTMFEITSGEIQGEQRNMMLWGMRGMAVALPVLTYAMPAGIFVYWCTIGSISCVQGLVLQQQGVKDYLGLKNPPPVEPVPAGAKTPEKPNPFTKMMDAVRKDNEKNHDPIFTNSDPTNTRITIVDKDSKPHQAVEAEIIETSTRHSIQTNKMKKNKSKK
mmetsp:Transcript_20077/g.19374  ORF Transcript_20077/g.19374 Transcript_20077/m.19374 type:complete len:416 (+) Transcript_20077:119-1366(+)